MRSDRSVKIGVFYDGHFFFNVSSYYNFVHQRRARLDIAGLHDFIRHQVALEEECDERFCRIVDAHYFRGRLGLNDPRANREQLLKERAFDDVLIKVGVNTHYLPLGPEGEKGIDVWLALEAYEMSQNNKLDVLVLVGGDGDFLPLLRKLNRMGTRVMLLGWDFEYTDNESRVCKTRTAQWLIDEATYPIMMNSVIDDRTSAGDRYIDNMFCKKELAHSSVSAEETSANMKHMTGVVHSIIGTYGFIKPNNGDDNCFFHGNDVAGGVDLAHIPIGQEVDYWFVRDLKGAAARSVRLRKKV